MDLLLHPADDHGRDRQDARGRTSLSVAGIRARALDLYEVRGQRLKDLVALFRQVPRPPAG